MNELQNAQLQAQANMTNQLSAIPQYTYNGIAVQPAHTAADLIAMQNQLQNLHQAEAAMQSGQLPTKPVNIKASPEFGVDKDAYPPENLLEIFYIKHRVGDRWDSPNVMTIETAYFPMGVDFQSGNPRTYSYPGQSFRTREDAQTALVRMFRKHLVERVSDFLGSLTAIQLERAMTDDAECSLADALRGYIKEVSP